MPPRGLHLPHESATHYEVLGVPPFECNLAAIEAKSRERMREIRKYQTGPYAAEASAQLDLLATARTCLLNPNLKQAYDEGLRVLFDLPPGTIRSTYVPPSPDPATAATISARTSRIQKWAWAVAVFALAAGALWLWKHDFRSSSLPVRTPGIAPPRS